ncbi:MAG: lysophospholipid acyltransferase family protein [Campylobacterota bacterium]|nr:lysophospholipid acyltransferase family protein [Campylobacterota bacterium]
MITVEGTLRSQYPKLFTFPTYLHKPTVSFLKLLFHEKSIHSFLKEHNETGLNFINAVLDHLNISYKVDTKQVQNIPALGKVIIVANHPLGALDALALIQMVSSLRQDKKVKIVANNMLSKFSQLKEQLIPVDNLSGKLSKESLCKVDEALNNEEAVIFFPSGEVSRAYLNGIRDGKWKSGFVKFAKRTQSPILPVYINAKNSLLFYGASWVYRPLGTILLSHEMFMARNSVFEFTVGEQITAHAISSMHLDYKQHAKLFRRHLYRLARGKKGIYTTEQCIAHPESRQTIKQELKQGEQLGTTTDNKQIYLIESEYAPTLISEIGRLREYSFRKVGEGSGQRKDIDKYDEYYQHLVLWDEDALEVVGAYRIGECDWILSWLGKEGLYLNELCKIDESADAYLNEGIELGRSFVQPKYWGTRALDYLWQGIGAYLSHNPQIRYMFGAVSISGSYPQHAKEALVYFYNNYFGSKTPSLHARTPYHLSQFTKDEMQQIFQGNDYSADFKRLRDYLKAFNVTVPTLYKQYSDICTEGGVEFMDFGIDTEFNDCIDGYIVVDIQKLKPEKRERYITNAI